MKCRTRIFRTLRKCRNRCIALRRSSRRVRSTKHEFLFALEEGDRMVLDPSAPSVVYGEYTSNQIIVWRNPVVNDTKNIRKRHTLQSHRDVLNNTRCPSSTPSQAKRSSSARPAAARWRAAAPRPSPRSSTSMLEVVRSTRPRSHERPQAERGAPVGPPPTDERSCRGAWAPRGAEQKRHRSPRN